MATAEQLRAACDALYGPRSGGPQRAQATQFLTAAAEQPQAWGACLELVRSPSEAVATRFWAANALFAKTKKANRELPPAAAAELGAHLLAVLKTDLAPEIAERIAVTVATLALQAEDADDGASQSLENCARAALEVCEAGRARSGLGLLRSLADELDAVDCAPRRRYDLEARARGVARRAALPALSRALAAARDGDQALLLLNCAKSWLGRAEATLVDLVTGADFELGRFLERCVSADCGSDELRWQLAGVAAVTFAEACRRGREGEDDADGPALASCERFCARCRSLVDRSAELTRSGTLDGEAAASECAKHVASVAAALSSSIHGAQLCLSFGVWELALAATAHPRRSVGVVALDAWLDLQDVPVDQRHASLGAPTYRRVLDALVAQCAASRNDYDEDEADALHGFRESSQDVLVATYFLLRGEYSATLGRALGNALQAVAAGDAAAVALAESALFALRAAKREILADLAKAGKAAADPAVRDALETTLGFCMCPAFGELFGAGRGFVFCCGAADLLGAFASLLSASADGAKPTLVAVAVRFLGGALDASRGKDEALATSCAAAVRSICVAHAKELWRDDGARAALVDAHANAVRRREDAPTLLAARHAVEGAVRVVAAASKSVRGLETTDEAAVAVAFDPVLAALSAAVDRARAAGPDDPGRFRGVADALGLVEVAANFATEKLRTLLGTRLWPLLGPCHEAPLRDDYDVVARALATHGAVALPRPSERSPPAAVGFASPPSSPTSPASARSAAALRHASELADLSLRYFERGGWACALDALGATVEALAPPKQAYGPDGAVGGSDERAALELLNGVATRAVVKGRDLLSSGAAGAHASQLFEFLKRYLLLCPAALFAPPQLLALVWDLSLAHLEASDVSLGSDGAKENVVFLGHLAKKAEAAPGAFAAPFVQANLGHLRARGAAAVRGLVAKLAGPAPSTLRPALAECLHAVCAPAPDLARDWLGGALADAALFDARTLPLEERGRVHAALCGLLPEKPKFKALAVDLAKIACGEASVDALLAYEIPAH